MSPEDRVKFQIGDLVVQVAVLTSQLEAKDERIKELEAKIPKEEAAS